MRPGDKFEIRPDKASGIFVYTPEFQKSRHFALFLTAGIFILFVLCFFWSGEKEANALPVSRESASVVLRVSEYTPPAPEETVKPAERKLLTEKSDFKIPEPPPIEKKPEPKVKKVPEKIIPPIKKAVKKQPERKKDVIKEIKAEEPAAGIPAEEEFTAENAPAAESPTFGALSGGTDAIGHPEGTVTDADIKSAAAAKILYEAERHKKYPKQARRAGMEGIVRLLVSIGPEGVVEAVEIEASSGLSVLDNAAKTIGNRLLGLRVVEKNVRSEPFMVIVPVDYSLKEGR